MKGHEQGQAQSTILDREIMLVKPDIHIKNEQTRGATGNRPITTGVFLRPLPELIQVTYSDFRPILHQGLFICTDDRK
jgi:hypothetical protein